MTRHDYEGTTFYSRSFRTNENELSTLEKIAVGAFITLCVASVPMSLGEIFGTTTNLIEAVGAFISSYVV